MTSVHTMKYYGSTFVTSCTTDVTTPRIWDSVAAWVKWAAVIRSQAFEGPFFKGWRWEQIHRLPVLCVGFDMEGCSDSPGPRLLSSINKEYIKNINVVKFYIRVKKTTCRETGSFAITVLPDDSRIWILYYNCMSLNVAEVLFAL